MTQWIKKRVAWFLLAGVWLMATTAQAELIVLAAPLSDDPYYAEVREGIFDFHVAFANGIGAGDSVLVLTDGASYEKYARVLGAERVAIAPMPDIWMRDFSDANPTHPVMFRYTAAGQGGGRVGQREADQVQDVLFALTQKARLDFQESDLLNDGGNWVTDGFGQVVVSRKFLRDNALTEAAARKRLRKLPGVNHIAFIEADEQGGLEHADGVVNFVGENILMVNSYPDDPDYARELEADLKRGLPGVQIHPITTPYDGSQVYDERFGSACGLYTNALTTPNYIYLPQFGIPQDQIAIKQIKALTNKQIIPIPTEQVCFMGGGVRCMSWQLRGGNASRLLDYFRKGDVGR
ncbi:MAG: agmatine deiminase family protein [Magnetococcales bacterium]|nr:agmatine deiminase family protein [Magnetococcales bacterium]